MVCLGGFVLWFMMAWLLVWGTWVVALDLVVASYLVSVLVVGICAGSLVLWVGWMVRLV